MFFSTGVHPKAFQHFSCGPESDRLALLLDRQSRQKDRNKAVLPEGHAEFGMASDLKDEPPVPPLINELILWQAPDRQSAKNERARTEAQILCSLFALHPYYFNTASPFQLLFGDEEVGVFELKYLGSGRHPG